MTGILLSSILGGFFACDVTAAGQIMISRPIFCAPIIGFLLGDVMAGFYVGVLMELLWISVVPLGNAVPPDSTIVAVSATYLAAVSPFGDTKAYVLFLLLCLVPTGIIFKKIDMMHRDINSVFSRKLEERIDEGDFSWIDKITYIGALIFIVKAAIFLFVIMVLGEQMFPVIFGLFSDRVVEVFENAYFAVPAIGIGTAFTTFIFKRSQSKR